MSSSSFIKRYSVFFVLLAAMLWATDAPFRVYLTKDLPVSFIVFAEHLFDCLIIAPFFFPQISKLKNLTRKEWIAILVIGVGGSALSTLAFTQSFSYVSPSVAILLQKLQPLVVILCSWVFLKERLTSRFFLWAVIALIGAYLISFPELNPSISFFGDASETMKGVLLALFATGLWGLSTVFGKYLLHNVDTTLVTSLRFYTAFVFLFLWNIGFHSFPTMSSVTSTDWIFLLVIAIASGVVSLTLYYRGLQHCPASIATLAELGFPVAAVIINWIFLKDTLTPVQILGVVIVFAAISQVGRKPKELVESEL